MVQVYATDGDETLGGSDLDLCLSAFIKQRVREVSGLVVDELYWEQDDRQQVRVLSYRDSFHLLSVYVCVYVCHYRQDELCLPASVHSKAEEVKKQLTYADSVEFSCIPPQPSGSEADRGRAAVRFNVTRSEFEGEKCRWLLFCMYASIHEQCS